MTWPCVAPASSHASAHRVPLWSHLHAENLNSYMSTSPWTRFCFFLFSISASIGIWLHETFCFQRTMLWRFVILDLPETSTKTLITCAKEMWVYQSLPHLTDCFQQSREITQLKQSYRSLGRKEKCSYPWKVETKVGLAESKAGPAHIV